MEQQIQEHDILDFLDKLKLFVENVGDYKYHLINEQFLCLIQTSERQLAVSIDMLIANREKRLSQKDFQELVAKLNTADKPKVEVTPVAGPTTKKRFAWGAFIAIVLLSLGFLSAAGAAVYFYFEWEQEKSFKEWYRDNAGSSYMPDETYETPEPEPRKMTEEEMRQEIRNKEAKNFKKYLSFDGSYDFNFFDEIKINGSISNTATEVTFKDVRIRVSGLSKTGAAIESKEYAFYEFFYPNKSFEVNLNTGSWKSSVTKVSVDIISAKVESN